jgi:hypothetical protein
MGVCNFIDLAIDIERVATQLQARSSEVGRSRDEKESVIAWHAPYPGSTKTHPIETLICIT